MNNIDTKGYNIWFRQPAGNWKEGIPLGNGHMGAMVCGKVDKEIINLSEATCFSGEASIENNQKDAYKYFHRMREAVAREEYEEARELSQKFIGKRLNYGTNLPLGNLVIEEHETDGEITDYARSLSIDEAVSCVSYIKDGVLFERTMFISNPSEVFVINITANKPNSINLDLWLDGGNNCSKSEIDDKMDFLLFGNAFEKLHSDGNTGVKFHGRMRILPRGGTIEAANSKIFVRNSSEVIVLISLATDFDKVDPVPKCLERINKASEISFEELMEVHIRDYEEIFKRVDLRLVKEINYNEPTDIWLGKIKAGMEDPSLTALMFQYGRYLIISSSRENSLLPAHLQGVWNDYVACRIGWTCDMHLDINTQMNYWPVEVANISECGSPLFGWVKNTLVPSGRITAHEAYGLTGWVAELVSNAWGFSAPYWHSNISPCPTGGVWIATHLWEHYQFTGDTDFLANDAYPVLKEAAQFFIEYVFEDSRTGYLIGGPSISPENLFRLKGKDFSFSNGCTYEIIMIRELFDEFIKASAVLGLENELIDRVKAAVRKLLPFQTGKQGELKEWMHDYEPGDKQHRHTSHLLSVYPFHQITPEKSPELVKAVNKSLELKLNPIEKWEDTGWARSMLMLYAARLHEGNKAYQHIMAMQKHLTNNNLMVKHPSTRGASAFDDVYELDGNTGLTACIAEMLIQSHDDRIRLLPALPDKWDSGYVTGLCARGGFVVDIYWKDAKLVKADIYSKYNRVCNVKYGQHYLSFNAEEGERYSIDNSLLLINHK